MKYLIRAEDNDTGQVTEKTVELAIGESVAETFPTALGERVWNILDVTPVGEEDEAPPVDPQFPDRPTHPDFARLVAAGAAMDEAFDGPGSPPEQIGIDEQSLLYMASNRLGTAWHHPLVQVMPRTVQMQGAWVDGFAVGVEYQRRGGSREVTK